MATGNGDVFRLHLLRHAHAAWPEAGRKDFDRRLDDHGRIEARDIAVQAQMRGLLPDIIVCSPAIRCHETSTIFMETTGSPDIVYEETLYSEGLEAYMAQIRLFQDQRSLMLIGHNPMIEGLASMLAATGPISEQLALGYPTAGLLSLEFDRPLGLSLFHKGRAVDLITPDFT